MTAPTYGNVLEMIGNTPLMAVRHLDTGPCELFVKLENQNPGGSIKDRVGLYLVQAAERSGKLAPGGTLVEATAGNTGVGLALVAAVRGYRLACVMPAKMSADKVAALTALGAEVIVVPNAPPSAPDNFQNVARRQKFDRRTGLFRPRRQSQRMRQGKRQRRLCGDFDLLVAGRCASNQPPNCTHGRANPSPFAATGYTSYQRTGGSATARRHGRSFALAFHGAVPACRLKRMVMSTNGDAFQRNGQFALSFDFAFRLGGKYRASNA